jgi:hypothetical protein
LLQTFIADIAKQNKITAQACQRTRGDNLSFGKSGMQWANALYQAKPEPPPSDRAARRHDAIRDARLAPGGGAWGRDVGTISIRSFISFEDRQKSAYQKDENTDHAPDKQRGKNRVNGRLKNSAATCAQNIPVLGLELVAPE